MKKISFKFTLEKEVAVITAFLWAYLLYRFYKGTDFSLNIPAELYISQATLDGTDVGARVKFFYQVLISGIFLYPFLYFVFYQLNSFFKFHNRDLKSAAIIAVTGFILIISDILGAESAKSIEFLLVLLFLTILFAAIAKSSVGVFRFADYLSFTATIFTLAFIILFTVLFLFNSNRTVQGSSNLLYFILCIGVGSFILLVKKITGAFSRRIFSFALPVAFLPLFAFISIELFFYLKIKQDFFIPYKWLFLGFAFLTFICFTLYNLKRPIKTSAYRMLSVLYAPAAIIAFLLLTSYVPIQQQSQEIFESANVANAQMRIFAFHEIPFVDFMSSHLLSEQFSGIIYNIFFGYDGSLDFMIYSFLVYGIFLAMIYYFTLRLFKHPALSVLFLITFPFLSELFFARVFFAMIVFFSAYRLVKKQDALNYLLLFSLIACMVLWNLDTGAATIFTTAVFLPITFFTERKKIIVSPLLKSSAIFFLVIIVVSTMLIFLRSPLYLWENFKSAFHYISANQAHGYSAIATEFNQQFYIYHLLIPTSCFFFIGSIIYILRNTLYTKVEHAHFILNASLFLYLICLANFQRGLVRHSFAEGQDHILASTFFIATALFLLYIVKAGNMVQRYAFFFTLSFFLIILLKYFPISTGKTHLEQFLSETTLKNLDTNLKEANFKGRTIRNEKFANENYIELKSFLDKNLSPTQTFLDFSNSPLLYYYCQRKVPSYFCQSQQNTVDDFLQIQTLKKLNTNEVPVAIYSNFPLNGWDGIDDVPNVMRQYLLAEYIFQNYKPYAILNKRSIWVSKSGNYAGNIGQIDTTASQPKTYNYKKAAYFINRYFENKKYFGLRYAGEEKTFLNKTTERYTFSIKDEIASIPSIFIKITIDNPVEGQEIKVHIADDQGITGSFLFKTTAKDNAYMLRLSNQYLWHIKPSKYLFIDQTESLSVTKIEFYKDIRF